MSKTHDVEEIEELENVKEEEEEETIPLKLQIEGPGCCDSREAGGVPCNYELKSAMSCWHWEGVNELREAPDEADPSITAETA